MPVKTGIQFLSFLNVPGFAPADEGLLFRQKAPKPLRPCAALRVPCAAEPNPEAAQLASGVVQKGPLACAKPKFCFGEARSSKAAGSEKSEAYRISTLRASSANGAKSAKYVSPKAENAAGGLFQQLLRSDSARLNSEFGSAAWPRTRG